MSKIDLPTGGWASFREPSSITNRERRKLMLDWEADKSEPAAKGVAFTDALIALFIDEWSNDLPLPRDNLDVLGDLACHDYDTLQREAIRLQGDLFLKFDPDPDPKVPTGPSSG